MVTAPDRRGPDDQRYCHEDRKFTVFSKRRLGTLIATGLLAAGCV